MPDQRRLAGARGADQRHHLARSDGEFEIVERLSAIDKCLAETSDFNGVHTPRRKRWGPTTLCLCRLHDTRLTVK